MKKSELKQIIKEEIQQGNYPELHKIITAKDRPPFMTEEDWRKKWIKEAIDDDVYKMWDSINDSVSSLSDIAKELKDSKLKKSVRKIENELEIIYDILSAGHGYTL